MISLIYKLRILLLVFICFSSISCKKFMEVYSQNDSFITSADDLEELLIQDGYFAFNAVPYTPYMFEIDDDVQLGLVSSTHDNITWEDGYYKWKPNPRVNSKGQVTATDDSFTKFYARIARLNTILGSIPDIRSKGGDQARLNKIAGECHFLRAYYYYFLANAFGKPYKKATAATDYCVPLKLEAAIQDRFATRATNKQVYDQMLLDLQEAEKLVGEANEGSKIRVNKTIIHLFLSRIHLYMENYEDVIKYADLAIQNNNFQIVDLNSFNPATSYIIRSSPDIVFSMCYNRLYSQAGLQQDIPSTTYFQPSDELIGLYDINDLRRNAFFVKNSKGTWKFGKVKEQNYNNAEMVGDIFALRKTEAYLNKAEALAILERTGEARNTVQELRKKRFNPADLTDINEEGAALVEFIRDERRRELFMEGHRWFDLRRYAVNSLFPSTKTIRHRNTTLIFGQFQEDGYFELGTYDSEPGSYVIPIAQDEIEFNQGRIENEERPERPLKH